MLNSWRAVALIAANFVRQQRWYVVLLLLWTSGTAMAFGIGGSGAVSDDLLLYMHGQAVYGGALALLLTSSALHNERRTRRILSVLSKSVTRTEYLAGLLCGSLAITFVFCAASGAAAFITAARLRVDLTYAPTYAIYLFAACTLVSVLSLLFATFLHPLVATAAAPVTVGVQLTIERAAGLNNGPVTTLSRALVGFDSLAGMHAGSAAVACVGEAALLFWLATRIFALRDIAVAVE
jgi:ABC-type transport system involved in multi-copper enzyme maturation permease subunit